MKFLVVHEVAALGNLIEVTNSANGHKSGFIGLEISVAESGQTPEKVTFLFHPGHLERVLPKLQGTLALVTSKGTGSHPH